MMRRIWFILALFWVCGAAPALAEWRRAESPNFIVFSEGSEARLRERILLLEDFDRLLRILTSVSGPPTPNKLHVYLVNGTADLRLVRPVSRNVGGFYSASPYGIATVVDARADARGTRDDDNEVLFHEYAHHFMMQYAATAYPPWYIEGFAEYYMTARFSDTAIEFGNFSEGRAYAIVLGEWLPMERILFGDTRGLNAEQMALFYAQSWLTVHYFFRTPERQQALRRYLSSPRGDNPAAAFQAATGLTPEQLRSELRRYIRGGEIRYHRMTRASAETPPPVTVTRLPASADDLMLYDAALKIGVDDERQPAVLQAIRTAAARHGDDPYARRVLAHAEILFGDAAAGARLLDALMAAAPADAELMYLKGMHHLRAAEKGEEWETEAREARRWFTRAHRADPNHFQTLYRFSQSLRMEREYVSENTRNVLLLAHELAPQVGEITINAAMLLMRRREFGDAEALLRPLAANPHDAGLAQVAQQLLDQARARTVPGEEPPEAAEPDGPEG
ncbi:MAG TPA: hypothetical protein VN231_05390 [Allosphingosinicella sp.]|nr:hypothetical protein [Allosphingosinicella sp.]